jgi:hypothetical protein
MNIATSATHDHTSICGKKNNMNSPFLHPKKYPCGSRVTPDGRGHPFKLSQAPLVVVVASRQPAAVASRQPAVVPEGRRSNSPWEPRGVEHQWARRRGSENAGDPQLVCCCRLCFSVLPVSLRRTSLSFQTSRSLGACHLTLWNRAGGISRSGLRSSSSRLLKSSCIEQLLESEVP